MGWFQPPTNFKTTSSAGVSFPYRSHMSGSHYWGPRITLDGWYEKPPLQVIQSDLFILKRWRSLNHLKGSRFTIAKRSRLESPGSRVFFGSFFTDKLGIRNPGNDSVLALVGNKSDLTSDRQARSVGSNQGFSNKKNPHEKKWFRKKEERYLEAELDRFFFGSCFFCFGWANF